MAISRFSTSRLTQGLPKFQTASDPNVYIGSFYQLGVQTLGASASSVTFNSIPQEYTHLQIRCVSQVQYGANDWGSIGIRFNGDTGSNYTRSNFYGSGTTASGSVLTSDFIEAGFTSLVGSNTSVFSPSISTILNYRSGKIKTIKNISGHDAASIGASAVTSTSGGIWNNASAITSITIYSSNGNWNANSTFALYGIK